MDGLVNYMIELFNGLNANFTIFVISMIPILELRGGMIAARILSVPYVRALLICVVGNIIPIPFILLFIDKIFYVLKKISITKPLVEYLEKKAMGKSDKIKRYEFWGILLFVGIPLPGTGAWTGSLIASLLRVKLKKSIPAVLLGIMLAACIMSIVAYFVPFVIGKIL